MITIRAVVLGNSLKHALFLAKEIKSSCGGELTTLADGNRVYCSLQCDTPVSQFTTIKECVAESILTELSIRDMFEENLIALGCPFTFIDDCDTDDALTLDDMKECDGSDELLVHLFELESLRNILSLRQDSFKFAKAIDCLLPYIKKSIFAKKNVPESDGKE